MALPVYIGVDGGGTHTRLVAVQEDGAVLGSVEGLGINCNAIGMQEARMRLKQALDKLLESLRLEGCAGICVGSSALDARADAGLVKEFCGPLLDAGSMLMDSDVFVALTGAFVGQPGVMVISGTGSMVVGTDDAGKVAVSGGWGYKLGEPGGGYGIATEGLKAGFASLEAVGEETALGQAALDFWHCGNSRELLAAIYDEASQPSDMAGFAGSVVALAEQGDAVAARIAREQMVMLAHMTASVMASCPHRLCLYGGIFEHSDFMRRLFTGALHEMLPDAELCTMAFPPEIGAVLLIMKERGVLSEAVIGNIKKTWSKQKA